MEYVYPWQLYIVIKVCCYCLGMISDSEKLLEGAKSEYARLVENMKSMNGTSELPAVYVYNHCVWS